MAKKKIALEEAERLLPKCVYRRHGSLYYVSHDKTTKKATWFPLGKSWDSSARKKWESLVLRHRSGGHASRVLYAVGSGPIPEKFLKQQLVNAKKNAKARGLEFSLTMDDMKAMSESSQGKCSLSGIPFEFGAAKEMDGLTSRRKRVWAPSLDRIDGTVGYTAGNVRLVCMAVNIARQEFGDKVLLKMAKHLSNIQYFGKRRRPADH